jgi:hypothetical protein
MRQNPKLTGVLTLKIIKFTPHIMYIFWRVTKDIYVPLFHLKMAMLPCSCLTRQTPSQFYQKLTSLVNPPLTYQSMLMSMPSQMAKLMSQSLVDQDTPQLVDWCLTPTCTTQYRPQKRVPIASCMLSAAGTTMHSP